MSVSKATWEAFKAQYADTCCIIQIDNARRIYIGYPSNKNSRVGAGPMSLNDIECVTIGDTDFLKVKYTAVHTEERTQYSFYSFVPLDDIQGFHVCEDKDSKGNTILIDPMVFN